MIVANLPERDLLLSELTPLLRWDPASDDTKIDRLRKIYSSVEDPQVPGALIPLVRDSHMAFVAVADTPADWRRLAPLTMAAVGVTLTDFDGIPAVTDDQVGILLTEHGLVYKSFKTRVGDRKAAGKAVDALQRLIHTLQTMPVPPRDLPRSAPQLLHEFDVALQSGDRDTSFDRLRELEQRRVVDTLNLRFLAVRWHAMFREWQQLLDEHWFLDLCRTRRPPRVTAALLRAIFEVQLNGAELLSNPSALSERFQQRVGNDAAGLFRELLPEPDAKTAIMFALDASAKGDYERIAALVQINTYDWEPSERSALEAVLALGESSSSSSAVTAEQAPIQTLLRLANGPPLTDAERIAVRQLIEEGGAALNVVELGTALVSGQADVYPAEEGPSRKSSVKFQDDWTTSSWDGWFSALPGLSHRRARELAERLADEVDVRATLESDKAVEHFAEALEVALSNDEESAVQALPHIVRWLQSDAGWPNADFASLYKSLVTYLLIFDMHTTGSLALALTLFEGWLSTGPRASDYSELLADIRGALDALASQSAINLFIDLAECLVFHPAPDKAAQQLLWEKLEFHLHRFHSRMTISQAVVMNEICEAMSVPASFEIPAREIESRDPLSSWDGMIGIYSLRTAMKSRVVDALRLRMPKARVEWREDHVSSPQLRQFAARADVMVVDWSSAKHPATEAICEVLKGGGPVWFNGGASSMISKVFDSISAKLGVEDSLSLPA
ncbi:MAG: protein DpdD [Chloroflexi bacterium]|nr:protein DpdD [Chloroflexota bacterium]